MGGAKPEDDLPKAREPSDRSERFTSEEAARIARMLLAGGRSMPCPHCNTALIQEAVLGMTMDTIVLIRCPSCGRAAGLKDLPPPGPPPKNPP